jgi:hypothetical protein
MATELYSEQPETGVERKIRATSGLVRYDAKNETLEWPRAVKDALANEKAGRHRRNARAQ